MISNAKINIRHLAESINLIKCPCCCSATFLTPEKLQEHLVALQQKLSSLQCYACATKFASLQEYSEHLVNKCPKTQQPEKHVIECSNIDSPQKATVVASNSTLRGLRILRVLHKSPSKKSETGNIKIITPTTASPMLNVGQDVKRVLLLKPPQKVISDRKRPADGSPDANKHSVDSKKQKIVTQEPLVERKSEDAVSVDLGSDDENGHDDDFSESMLISQEVNSEENVEIGNSTDAKIKTIATKVVKEKVVLYKCRLCNFKTHDLDKQTKHKCQKCPFCDKVFNSQSSASPHIRQHKLDMLEEELNTIMIGLPDEVVSVFCNKCCLDFASETVETHIKIHKEGAKVHQCTSCKKCFLSKFSLTEHSKSCGKEEIRETEEAAENIGKFECTICKIKFNRRAAYRKHRQEEHPYGQKGIRSKMNCGFCEMTGFTLPGITKHILSEHPTVEMKINENNILPEMSVCSHHCRVCKEDVEDANLHNQLHQSGVEVFKCIACPSKFIALERLNKHLKDVHDMAPTMSKMFACRECPKSYASRSSLQLHCMASNHCRDMLTDTTIYQCRYCSKGHLRKRDLWKHENVHIAKGEILLAGQQDQTANSNYSSAPTNPSPFKCQTCDKVFGSKISAEVHAVARNHMAGFEYVQVLTCNICKKKFARKRELRRHLAKHAERGDLELSTECELCGKKCSSSQGLKVHVQSHAQFSCPHCKKYFLEEQDLLSHVNKAHPDKEQMLKCNLCTKYFKDLDQLRNHLPSIDHLESQLNQTIVTSYDLTFCDSCQECISVDLKDIHDAMHHRGVGKLFKCTECPSHFYSALSLGVHAKASHKSGIMFQCPVCSINVCSAASLNYHYQRHVTTMAVLKTLKCQFCPKTFRRTADRHKHELIHKGTKDHACKLCPKTFRLAQMLYVHMRTHTNERPYKCKECDMAFKSNSAMHNHIRSKHRTERNFVCTYCPKAFKTRAAWHGHVGSHEKLFKCEDCGRAFYSRNAATQHIKLIHLPKNRELFECVLCNATYGRSLALIKHMKTDHAKLEGKDDLLQKLLEVSNVTYTSPKKSRATKSK
ncbi:zinc finger protein 26-like isoform X2 [Neocloeon triangulifer]|uniref:zinc finger protein 26-like isoform X2 n=1 Tax=Neocloeon triangulifer TaxID=2078957 RepID=UPI00286FA0FA|nr:zinc finger protein 26-like isoform X2 [Neocloeon triangulifer]